MLEPIAWRDLLIVPVEEAIFSIAGYLPYIIGSLVIFVSGCFFAVIVRLLVGRTLKAIRFDAFAQRVGIRSFFEHTGIAEAPHLVVAKTAFWLLLLVVSLVALNALRIPAMDEIIHSVMGLVPALISAGIIFVLGLGLASLIRIRLKHALEGALSEKADVVADSVYWVLLAFVATASLNKMGIDTALLENAVSIVLACSALALAIAFGLGGKDRAGKLLDDLLEGKEKGR